MEEVQHELRSCVPLDRVRQVPLHSQKHARRRFSCEDEDSHSRVAAVEKIEHTWFGSEDQADGSGRRNLPPQGWDCDEEQRWREGERDSSWGHDGAGRVLGLRRPAMKTPEAVRGPIETTQGSSGLVVAVVKSLAKDLVSS